MWGMRNESCERARRWVSVRLDEDLSELEGRLLVAHLHECSDCCDFERGTRSVAEALRAEPLVALEHPVALPQRRRRVAGVLGVASAAAAVVAAAAFGLLSLVSSSDRVRPDFLVKTSQARNTEATSLRALRRTELLAPKPVPLFTHVQPMSVDAL